MAKDTQKKNILITGGAGFIGSHLCERFVEQGHHVICVDNFITGSQKNIDLLLPYQNFKFLKHDMVQPLRLEAFPELQNLQILYKGIQQVYHLACPTSPKEYDKLPIETLTANSHGTYNALMIAKQFGSTFLHLSTSSVYGDPLPGMTRFKEDYWGYVDPIGPRSCYNEGKRFAESMVMNFRLFYKVNAKIARVFNAYGPNMKLHDGRIIPDFITHALDNEPLTVYGGEEAISSFLYIDDLIDGLLKFMEMDAGGPINFGSHEAYRVADIAQLVITLTESVSEIKTAETLPYVSRQGLPDISLAKKQLGWFPLVEIQEGLTKTIEYMKSQRGVLDVSS